MQPPDPVALPNVDRRRVTFFNAAFAYAALVLTLIQGVFLIPVFIRRIDVGLYGAWLASGNILAWIELADPGITTIVQQRVAYLYGARESEQMGRAAGTALTVSALLAALPLPLVFAAPWIVRGFSLPQDQAAVLAFSFELGVVAAVFTVFSVVLGAVNTGFQLTLETGAISVLGGVVGLALTLALILGGAGLISIPLGLLGRSLVLVLGNALVYWRFSTRVLGRRNTRFSRSEFLTLRGMLGLTFLLRLGGVLVERMEALLAARLVSPQAAACLVLTGRAAEIGRAFASRIAPALVPGISHLAGEGGKERIAALYERFAVAQGAVVAVLVGGIVATNQFFVTAWVGGRLYAGQTVTVLQAWSVGLWILVSAMYQVIVACGAIRAVVLLPLAEASVRLPLQFALAPSLGVVAFPLASSISISLVSFVWALTVSRRTVDTEELRATRVWARSAAVIAVGIAVGAAAHTLLVPVWNVHPSTLRFVVLAGTAALALVTLVLLFDQRARKLVGQMLDVLAKRWAPHAS